MNQVQPFHARSERGRSCCFAQPVHSSQKDVRGVHREVRRPLILPPEITAAQDCMRILEVLRDVATRQSQDMLAAWGNNHPGGVSLCLAMLVYQAGLRQERCERAIARLKKANVLSGGHIHWQILAPQIPSRPRLISAEIRLDVLSSGPCAHCDTLEDLEVDHIIPVSLGGSDERSNLQPLCVLCNRRKGNRFVG